MTDVPVTDTITTSISTAEGSHSVPSGDALARPDTARPEAADSTVSGPASVQASMPRVALVCAGLTGVLALVALAGWVTGTAALRELVPGQIGVKANSAVGLLLVAVAWLAGRRVGTVLAGLALALGAATLAEYVFGVDLGIDQLLFDDPARSAHPGRSSVLTVLCIMLVALARVFAYRGHGRRSQAVAFVALVIATVVLLGYLYDVRGLYSARPVTTVSLYTGLGTFLLAVAALAAVEGGIFTWAVRGTDAGAVLLRRLLPLALVGLPLIGLASLAARRASWLDDVASTVAVLIVVCGLAMGYLTWVAARRVAKIDRGRERAIRELVELKDDLERQVTERAGQLRRHGGHIAVLEDRQRIAADLHDIVIQRLFAAGMYLQGANHPGADPDVRDRINTAVEAMDIAIKDLRHSIFELGGGSLAPVDITTAVDDVCKEATRILGFRPEVVVDDPDFEAETVRDDLLAVLRESLANVARHAAATAVDVTVRAADGEVSLCIADNGKGMGEPSYNSGTRNMAERARQRGGDCTWEPNEPSGTRVYWHVPVG